MAKNEQQKKAAADAKLERQKRRQAGRGSKRRATSFKRNNGNGVDKPNDPRVKG